jgi:hypothetical protein
VPYGAAIVASDLSVGGDADNFQTRENINNFLLELEPTAFFPEAKKSARENKE